MNQDQYTVGNLFERTTCISKEMLLKYVDGQLSKQALRQVEMHLIDCPLCEIALEGIQAVGTVKFDNMLDRVSQRIADHNQHMEAPDDNIIEFRPTINPPIAARSIKRFLPMMGIAASIILLAIVAIMFMGGDSASSIADRHFQELTNRTSRSVSTGTKDLFDQADALYKAKDYAAAAAIYGQIGTPEANYCAGSSYYALGQYDLAADKFNAVIAAQKDWVEYASFNLALSYLKLDRIADAKSILEQISADEDHDFTQQAKETLKDVNGL